MTRGCSTKRRTRAGRLVHLQVVENHEHPAIRVPDQPAQEAKRDRRRERALQHYEAHRALIGHGGEKVHRRAARDHGERRRLVRDEALNRPLLRRRQGPLRADALGPGLARLTP